jgi:hypothetical protein
MSKKEKVTYLRCSLPKCDNPLVGKQRKYCSRKCLIKANCIARKGIYKELDGWAGGPRGLSTVESSIKKNESYVLGDGRFAVDDYPVDPDIFAIAEANHEQYVLDRNEYEARVVIDGLEIFIKEYDKHHDVSYGSEQGKKREANLTEDQKIARNIAQKHYYSNNKEKLNKQQRKSYKNNVEKRREYAKKYYRENIKKPELFKVEQWLKKRISGS